MSKLKNIIKDYIVIPAACIGVTFSPLLAKKVYAENQNPPIVYRGEGEVINNPENGSGTQGTGTCSDGIDNDNDGLIDRDDPDCIIQGVYDPRADEHTKQTTPPPTTQGIGGSVGYITGQTSLTTDYSTDREPEESTGNFTGFYGSVNVYDNGQIRITPFGRWLNLEETISCETFDDFESVDTSSWKLGILAQLYLKNGELIVEPFVSYENQTINRANNVFNDDFSTKTTDIELGTRARYQLISKENVKLGPWVEGRINFINLEQDDSTENINFPTENINLYNGRIGIFYQGNVLGLPITATTSYNYDQFADEEANRDELTTLNSSSVSIDALFGNKYYLFIGTKFPLSGDVEQTSTIIGGGIQNITKKFPIGIRGTYFTNSTEIDNGHNTRTRDNTGFGIELIYNQDFNNIFKSPLHTLQLE